MERIEGKLNGKGLKIAVIQARFNSFICSALLDGALDCLRRHEVAEEDVTVIKIPGAFEIPLVLKKVAESGKYDGAVCLGAVIRGATPHFDYVAGESARGMIQVMIDSGFPASNGIITTNNMEQAIERAGVKSGNKGSEAAVTLLELIHVTKSI